MSDLNSGMGMRVALAVALALVMGCSAIVEPAEESESEPVSRYFPLAEGNSWDYLQESLNRTTSHNSRVFGKARIDGRSYYLFSRPAAPVYLRVDPRGNVWRYNRGEENAWLLFNLPNGAVYQYPDTSVSAQTVTVTRGVTVDTPAGVFDDCIRFEFDVVGAVDDEHSITFAPDVGPISRNSVWFSFPRLLSAFNVSSPPTY